MKHSFSLYAVIPAMFFFTLVACGGGNTGKGGEASQSNYFSIHGFAEGTSYNITYRDDMRRNLQPEIEELLQQFEKSLSVYDSMSIISRVNRNEDVEVDDYFIGLFNRALEISGETNGAFDMSGEPLFRAWGFSFKNREPMNDHKVDSLKQYIGMDKIRLDGKRVVKANPNVVLNGNAIAKGYSSDIVARLLDDKGITDYLVEIGGEMRLKGQNSKGKMWRVGIDTPTDGNYIPGNELQTILQVTDKGLATSGNYRRFYIENGQKFSHTIDPKTGYPVKHNLLSATVIAGDCLSADAYATAFLVVGLDSAKVLLERLPELEAYFIYDEGGVFKEYYTPTMKSRIVEQ